MKKQMAGTTTYVDVPVCFLTKKGAFMAKVTKPVEKKKKTMNKTLKKIIGWIVQVILVLILSAVVAFSFLGTIVMQEGSMEPTIRANDHIRINRAAYLFDAPDRGDIIAFYKSDTKNGSVQIKRVIGLPGDTLQIKDGMIIINGETYLEDEQYSKINNSGLAEKEIKLKKEEYFVLGDNRNNSEDSRFVDMGNVKQANIIGKVWLISSPFSRFGFV